MPVLQRSFEPLAMVLRDAEQLPPAGTHIGASTRVELTARGQVHRTHQTVGVDTITTETTREHYSPCRIGQPEYNAADAVARTNFEVLNTYDDYEAGQLEVDPTFIDEPRLAQGRRVAVQDRGAHTRFNYDIRGRTRRVSRQVAKPLSQQVAGTDIYAPHWYKTRSDFDIADRLASRTSGADEGPFAEGPGSGESYLYSSRGQLASSWSWQHGTVIDNVSYEADGQVGHIRYGDIAATEAAFTYDTRRRLQTYKVDRAAPAVWTTASAGYTVPGGDTTLTTLADFAYHYDLVGNPMLIEDTTPIGVLPEHVWPQRARSMTYDDLYRMTSATYGYGTPNGAAIARPPFLPEQDAGDRTPAPRRALGSRVQTEGFAYDYLGNITASTDDLSASYDRSLGVSTHGNGGRPLGNGPNQLTAASGVQARYDATGDLEELKVERPGDCASGVSGSKCAQWYAYDWDEVGQLVRARRWDFEATLPDLGGVLPYDAPEWDLHYAYSGGARVIKSATNSTGVERHTLEIFSTLRLDHDEFIAATGDYERHRGQTHVYLAGGAGHVFYDGGQLPAPPGTPPTRLFLNVGDHLGSSSVTIDHTSSELVERTTFQSHGAIESELRPDRWGNAREPYKFTGKEEDIEVGATYFGARYYNAHLARFISPDPLTIHGLGADLNPYAYVRGRVMSHVDPLGLADTTPLPEGATEAPPQQNSGGTIKQPNGTIVTWRFSWGASTPSSVGGSARSDSVAGGKFTPEPGHENERIRVPGTRPYESAALAGWAALAEYNGFSIDTHRELAGIIYRTPNGNYASTPAVDTYDNTNAVSHPEVALWLVPAGAQPVGVWHTHASYNPIGNEVEGRNLATRQPGRNGDWIFSPVSPQDRSMLDTFIAEGTLPPDAISMVATSSGHVTLYNASTPMGGERYFFNSSFYVNLKGIKPNWTGVWFLGQTGKFTPPGR